MVTEKHLQSMNYRHLTGRKYTYCVCGSSRGPPTRSRGQNGG